MKIFIGLIAVGLLLLSADQSPATETNPRNVIFILVDDQRWDAIGKLNPFFETPHLDSLMDNGIYFPNMFVTTSLCSPSRASFLTGQWAHKHGVLNNSTLLGSDTPTFPQELQKAGYDTAFIGKWHMGGSTDEPRPGWDHWVSFRGQGVYFNQAFNVNGVREKSTGHNTDRVTDYAEEFIRRDHDKPFMLYVSHKAVHADFKPAKRHEGSYEGRTYPYPDTMADTEANYDGKPNWVKAQRNTWHGVDGLYNNTMDLDDFTRRYAETMKTVDDSVGRLMAVLKEEGLLESTLVIFTSDNGFQFGEHGLIDKRTMYEASIKIPLIVHCPELFEGGQVREQMVLNVDLFPTLMDVAGVATPDSVQGQSWWPIAQNGSVKGRESFLYTYFWERSFAQTPTVLGLRTNTHKFMQFQGIFDRYELYDIQNDPDEKHNLIGDIYTTTEAGDVTGRMRNRSKVPKELTELYMDMLGKLRQQLTELECSPEPNWRMVH